MPPGDQKQSGQPLTENVQAEPPRLQKQRASIGSAMSHLVTYSVSGCFGVRGLGLDGGVGLAGHLEAQLGVAQVLVLVEVTD